MIVAAYRHKRSLNTPERTAEWWADLVAKAKIEAFEGDQAIFIAGDLNAEHDIWMGKAADQKTPGSRSNPRHGEEIAMVALTAELYAIVDRDKPYTRMGNGHPTAIDVLWSTHRVKGQYKKWWGLSDHCYIAVGGPEGESTGKCTNRLRPEVTLGPAVNVKRVVAEFLEEEKNPENTLGDPWKRIKELCAKHRWMKPCGKGKSETWWTTELTTLKAIAHKAAKRHAERPGCYRRKEQRIQTRRDFRKALRHARAVAIEAETMALIEAANSEIEALYRERDRVSTTLETDKRPTPRVEGETQRETAERLNGHNFPSQRQQGVEAEELEGLEKQAQPRPLWKEVKRAISGKAAAGPDLMTSRLVHRILRTEEAEDILASEMEEAWQRGTPGEGWREVRIKYIPKPGKKEWERAGTWRPVGVMNTVGKIYSSGVAKDIQKRAVWHAPAYGAREGVGCIDIMLKSANLINHVAVDKAIPVVDKPTLVGIYFDAKSAYPGTSTAHLVEALRRHPEIGHWRKDIVNRAEPRKVKVEWDGMDDEEIWTVVSGLDQGDPASPVLWQMVMEGILLQLIQSLDLSRPEQTETIADSYADDGFIGRVGKMDIKATQQTIRDLASACEHVERVGGFTFPKEKMEVIVKGRHTVRQVTDMVWPHNIPLPKTECIERLGVELSLRQGNGRFDKLEKRYNFAQSKLTLLRRMWINHRWSLDAMLTMATTVLLPTVTYGCELWSNAGMINAAEKMWYGMVKRLLGWHGSIQQEALMYAMGIPSVRAYREHLRRRACIRMFRSRDHPAHASPTTKTTDEMKGEWLDPKMEPEALVPAGRSTWKVHLHATTQAAKEAGVGTESGRSWEDWAAHITESADLEEDRRTIFTDGSVLDDGRAGAGWSTYEGESAGLFVGKGMTSGDAEVLACIKALEGRSGKWLVLTDSMTAIDWLTGQQDSLPTTIVEARRDARDIQVGWVKGHTGIPGNDRADEEAKRAASSGDPDSPVQVFTLSWAKKEDTDRWEEAKHHSYWGNGRVRKWRKSAARSLLRVRQATGKCPLCDHGSDKQENITRHVMTECLELEDDRRESSLYNPARVGEPRGHPGWESWLSEEEHGHTELFLDRVAARWKECGAYPLERSVEAYGDEAAQAG